MSIASTANTNMGSIMANVTSFNVKWFILPGLIVLGAGSPVLAQRGPAQPTIMAGSSNNSCWSLAFSSDGQRLAGGFDDGSTRVWEAKTGKEIRTFGMEKSWCFGVAFNADGTVLATAARGNPYGAEKPGRIVLWDLNTGKALRSLEGGGAGAVAFSPDGKFLVGTASGKPAGLKLWDTASGKTVRTLAESGLDVTVGDRVAFSPDGKTIVGGGRDFKVKIWEASSGKVLHTLDEGYSSPVAFSKDGKRVVAGSLMTVWEVATGKKLLDIKKPHIKGNVGVAFSPDGKRLISAGNRPHSAGLLSLLEPWPPDNDGEIAVWDAEKGTKVRSFTTDVAGLWTAAVSPDGNRIAVSPSGGSRPVRVWAVNADHKDPPKNFTNSIGMKFVWIPPGNFVMGTPKEEKERDANQTQHKVTLTRGFYMGVHLVTQEQWQAVMGNNPSHFKGEKNLPVEQVSWKDSQEYVKKLRDKDKRPYRLPTEAEWEYSCRAGTTTPFHFGQTISTDQANYNGNHTYGDGKKGVYREKTMPVGSFPANAWGLHDMHGNLFSGARIGTETIRKKT